MGEDILQLLDDLLAERRSRERREEEEIAKAQALFDELVKRVKAEGTSMVISIPTDALQIFHGGARSSKERRAEREWGWEPWASHVVVRRQIADRGSPVRRVLFAALSGEASVELI